MTVPTRHRWRSRWLGARSGRLVAALSVAWALAAGSAGPAGAEGSWLDQPQPASWNQPGMAVPAAFAPDLPLDPRVVARERPPETPADAALAAAGWRLDAAYQAGWGVAVVIATSSYDGMGRPWDYQAFVFVDGALAGTLAPTPMQSRFDSALDRATLVGPDRLIAEFRRYAPRDPLCCPSGSAAVEYRIDRGDAGAVVVPVRVTQTGASTPVEAGK